ncbi:MAG: hypothetical protein LBP24_02505 [Coriobacteriales bacterium]|jgi:hypothetical protein|nr:hypothetical protein [Coriobacteriales bacterium]
MLPLAVGIRFMLGGLGEVSFAVISVLFAWGIGYFLLGLLHFAKYRYIRIYSFTLDEIDDREI